MRARWDRGRSYAERNARLPADARADNLDRGKGSVSRSAQSRIARRPVNRLRYRSGLIGAPRSQPGPERIPNPADRYLWGRHRPSSSRLAHVCFPANSPSGQSCRKNLPISMRMWSFVAETGNPGRCALCQKKKPKSNLFAHRRREWASSARPTNIATMS